MKSYYVIFSYEGKKICGTSQHATNREDACMLAEYSIMCHYPNIKYDSLEAIQK